MAFAILLAVTGPVAASCGEPEALGERIEPVEGVGLDVVGAVEHRVAAVSFPLPVLGRAWVSSLSRSWGDVSSPFEFDAAIDPVEAGHARSPCGGFPAIGDAEYTLVVQDADGVRSLWVGGSSSPDDLEQLEALLGEVTVAAEGDRLAVVWHTWWRTGLVVAAASILAVTTTRSALGAVAGRRERARSSETRADITIE